MNLPKINLFGDRVAISEFGDGVEMTGSLVLPQARTKAFSFAKVVAVGDGKFVADKDRPMFVKPEDVVIFQQNPLMVFNTAHRLNGNMVFVINQQDLIAKMTALVFKIENFQILGYWVLLEAFEDKDKDSVIVLPETVKKESRYLRYKVVQVGAGVTKVKIGDEVVPETSRANYMAIDSQPYWFVAQADICGIVEEV
jgi:co-chaperonin GroES (HSP10)